MELGGVSAFPRRVTRFIGRTDEIAAMCDALGRSRLVTLTGSGGCGKTRLALEVARRLESTFACGGAFVDLAPVDAPLVDNTFAAAAAVAEEGNLPLEELLCASLAERHVLLLVDNCEGVIEEAASVVDAIVARCPYTVVLATSREPLGVDGELTWRLPPLTLASPDDADPIAALHGSEAGMLLVDRAALARPDLEWTAARAAAGVTICRRLDGVPLAIELAASRLRVFEPGEIAVGLDDRFALLRVGRRTGPARQRTLEASIEWSVALTPKRAQLLFRRLGAFAAAFTVDDAVAVAADDELSAADITALLADLVERSVVHLEPDLTGATTYRMLESIRAYAAAQLIATGEDEAVRSRHLDHCATLAAAFEDVAETDALPAASARITRSLPDLRAAISWGLASGRLDAALAIAADLRLLWITSSRNQEGSDWLRMLLDAADRSPDDAVSPATRLSAVLAAAQLSLFAVDPFRQADLATEGLDLARQLDDRAAEARALTLLGWAQTFSSPALARPTLRAAVDLAREVDDPIRIEFASFGAGAAAVLDGDLAAASAHLETGLGLSLARNTFGQMFGLGILGYVRCLQGRLDEARQLLERACAFDGGDDTGFNRDLAHTWLAYTLTLQGEYELAGEHLTSTLDGARTIGNPPMFVLVGAGWLAHARGDHATAMAAAAEALPVFELVGIALWEVQALRLLGDATAACGGDPQPHWQRAMTRADASRNPIARTIALIGLAQSDAADPQRRRALLRDAVRTALGVGYRIGVIDALELLQVAAADELGSADAVRVARAIDAERRRIGYVRFPTLGPAPVVPPTAEGEALLVLQEAAAVACRGDRRPPRPSHGWASLTPAELRVARLVAEGLTNPQIGERLHLSRRTVQSHLSHVFAKLDLTSRTELATELTRRASDTNATNGATTGDDTKMRHLADAT